jgi:hypothetical protein
MARLHEYQGKAISPLTDSRFRVAALPTDEFANKDSELLACDVECRLAGVEGFYLALDIPGLDDVIGAAPRSSETR